MPVLQTFRTFLWGTFWSTISPCVLVLFFSCFRAYSHILLVGFWPGFTVQIGSDSEWVRVPARMWVRGGSPMGLILGVLAFFLFFIFLVTDSVIPYIHVGSTGSDRVRSMSAPNVTKIEIEIKLGSVIGWKAIWTKYSGCRSEIVFSLSYCYYLCVFVSCSLVLHLPKGLRLCRVMIGMHSKYWH